MARSAKKAHWVQVCRVPAGTPFDASTPLVSPGDVYRLFRERAGSLDAESIWVVYLDSQHRPRGVEEVAHGGINATSVFARELFRGAVTAGAVNIILVHNHPSGSLQPSTADRKLTLAAKEAGSLLGMGVVDHVIVTAESYFSFVEAGLI